MSAVVKAVTKVVDTVVEAVGDVVDTVVDVVKDVGSAIDDYVLQPIKEDPVSFVVQVAATAVGIPPPITAAAITAAKGGDLEDIGKSALAAYVAPKVGSTVATSVANATAGSALQNTLASAAGGAASGATSAAITGGDVGASALLGAAGSAGASIGREVAAAAEYGTDVFSPQTQQIVSQDVGVNRFSDIGADIGTALGRAAITGDVEGELLSAASGAGTREVAELLREAYVESKGSQEVAKAEEALAAELESNPAFAEQIQLAQIAAGDEVLTTDQKIDALAEAVARDAFAEAAAGGEQVAALPAVALPVAVNAAARAAQVAAPLVVRRVAQFAANDPRFAQVMITNPYTQQLLAAAGLTMTVSLTGDVQINPINIPDQSAAETARLARYASEIAKTVPNVNQDNARQLENTARQAEAPAAREDLVQRQADLQRLADQGFPVQRELERVEIALSQPIPTIDVTGDILQRQIENIPAQPGTLPPPTIDIRAEPVTRPTTTTRPGTTVTPTTAPEVRPGTAPTVTPTTRPGEEVAPETAPVTTPTTRPGEETAPETAPTTTPATRTRTQEETVTSTQPTPSVRPVTRLTPTPTGPTATPVGPRVPVTPIDIDDLFTDEDILDLIRQGLGDAFVEETTGAVDLGGEETGGDEVGPATEGGVTPVVDVRPGTVGKTPTPVQSITQRAVSTGPGAITGMKEPTFGGDPGSQQDVWNVRSLRLRKALGL
jgi:hypothetical protein